jgi:AraC-like DNA-binding protein
VELAFAYGSPHPRLRPYVERYCGYEERAGALLRRREMPGASVVLIVGWGDPLDVVDPRGGGAYGVTSFTAGMFDSYVVTSTAGVGRGVELTLEPLVAGRLLGLPMGELSNSVVALDDLPGGWGRGLRERLGEAPDWSSRFAVLDEVLGARLDAGATPDPRVQWAWDRLRHGHGDVSIAGLASELGWSRRHLASTFRREIGLTPKTAARVLRFGRAYAALGSSDGWADIAVSCGYYDQAHLIRDFKAFAGAPPGHIRPIAGAPGVAD